MKSLPPTAWVAIMVGFFSASALAGSKQVALSVDFRVHKCTAINYTGHSSFGCDNWANQAKTIKIDLKCDDENKVCRGTWSDASTRDGHDFFSKVFVEWTSFGNEYKLTASVGPTNESDPATEVRINLGEKGKLTQRVEFDGKWLIYKVSETEETDYESSLILAPEQN